MQANKVKNFLLDLFFPKFCFGCQREGSFLCSDCEATLDILLTHQEFQTVNLNNLYWAMEYKNPLIKNLIQRFKYEPFVKELAAPLSCLIIDHFQLLDNPPPFLGGGPNFIFLPVPLEKRRLRWRGFNQAEEIGKELSRFLKIPLINDVLIKIKETPPQIELLEKERRESVRGAFLVKNRSSIRNKMVLLVDDVYTTGATIKECASILRKAGAKEVIGIVVARASPGEDLFQNI